MIKIGDIKKVSIPDIDYKKIVDNAKKAEIGGVSHIRESNDRKHNLSMDQIVGQLGTYALTKFIFGDATSYFELREEVNKNPTKGDGGYDIKDIKMDVKTSMMRASKDPLRYRLAVRPRERHDDWIYVLGLIENINPPVDVMLVGWTKDSQLEGNLQTDGVFKGAYTIMAKDLTKIPNWDANKA